MKIEVDGKTVFEDDKVSLADTGLTKAGGCVLNLVEVVAITPHTMLFRNGVMIGGATFGSQGDFAKLIEAFG